jgi:chromosome segregation ATPase
VYNVAGPSLGSACREFGLAPWAMNIKHWEIEFVRRLLMHRSCVLIPVLLLIAAPVFGQSTSTDSQTLQALLAEVRQLRHDLQTTTIAAQRAQILLYRLQGQQLAVARESQRVEQAHGRLSETQTNRKKLATDIKQHEDFISQMENPPGERKEVEAVLPRLKERLQSLENEEQQRQTTEIEAEGRLQVESNKLNELQDQLDRLEKVLESTNRQSGTNPR